MAVQIPSAGSIFYTQYSAATVNSIGDGIANALISAGWTKSNAAATALFTFNGVPTNNQTCVVGSITYTFVTTLNNGVANQVHIGASAAACATNLSEAINAGAGSGTDYSTPTTANPNATGALPTSTTVRVTASAGGFSASSLAVTNSLTNVVLTEVFGGVAQGRGYTMSMPAATPQGLKMIVIIDDPGEAYCRIRVGSPDGSVISAANTVTHGGPAGAGFVIASARTQEIACCAHQFWTFLLGDTGTPFTVVACGIPYIRPFHTPVAVTAATNASPIQITTGTAHGLSTGEDVFIADVGGNANANGFFTVTVVNATTLTLNGSTGSGAYTSGGLLANQFQIARCMWLNCGSSGDNGGFRGSLVSGGGTGFVCVNQYSYSNNGSFTIGLIVPKIAVETGFPGTVNNGVVLNYGSVADLAEPRIAWALSSTGGNFYVYGQLWASFVTTEPVPIDRIKLGLSISGVNHDCINITDGFNEPRGSFWLLKN